MSEKPPTQQPQTSFQRYEEKLRLTPDAATSLYDTLSPKLQVDEFLPGQALTRVTTLYCDDAGLSLYREAKAGGPRTRIRIRIYSYPPPVEEDLFCWVERKTSPAKGVVGFTTKQRFRLPKELVGALFSGGLSVEELREFQATKKASREIEECYNFFCEVLAAHQIRPIVATSYHRRALLVGGKHDRITFDFNLQYHQVDWDPIGGACLGRGEPEGASIIELKHTAPLPDWMEEALLGYRAERVEGFSKFERAIEAIFPNLTVIPIR